MHVAVMVKQTGSRRDVLSPRMLTIRDGVGTLDGLITEIVMLSVREYNGKPTDPDIVKALTKEAIANQAQTGKVGFLRRIHSKNADEGEAVRNALQCFEDGLFRVFLDGEETTALGCELNLKEGSSLVFVRMAMLAGSMW